MTTLEATAETAPATEDIAEPEARILEHSYDGIREYDNPLPGWWRLVFYLTIVFSLGYGIYYHVVRWGSTKEQVYAAGLAEYDGKREQREAADAASASEESLKASASDPAVLARGSKIFASRCASCHEKGGQGVIGPNLTDGFQVHGTTRMDLFKTARGGVPGTAMIAWSEQMSGPDLVAVTAFVVSLRHTNVKGKEPQGRKVEPFPRN